MPPSDVRCEAMAERDVAGIHSPYDKGVEADLLFHWKTVDSAALVPTDVLQL
mgnify:CR=1 FL=1